MKKPPFHRGPAITHADWSIHDPLDLEYMEALVVDGDVDTLNLIASGKLPVSADTITWLEDNIPMAVMAKAAQK